MSVIIYFFIIECNPGLPGCAYLKVIIKRNLPVLYLHPTDLDSDGGTLESVFATCPYACFQVTVLINEFGCFSLCIGNSL